MTGLDGQRVYLDWNATAPLRPEARAAMLEAMDVVGNPSSVHAEGRAAKAIVEKARGQVAALVGCAVEELVFTSGATEAANIATSVGWDLAVLTPHEHDCVVASVAPETAGSLKTHVALSGSQSDMWASSAPLLAPWAPLHRTLLACTAACGETGIVHELDAIQQIAVRRQEKARNDATDADPEHCVRLFSDLTQAAGKIRFTAKGADYVCASAHKIGGPKGVGFLAGKQALNVSSFITGGGQEKGRRSGTENVIGIAGFGAAAQAAQRDLEADVWDRIENLRDSLEDRVATAAPDTIFFGKDAPRLPNTSCFAVPGWPGETQVMQMDLAGFAISAGSACSSGKVKKASRVLLAMGFNEITASSAIRVSMGPTTTEAEVMAFADSWIAAYQRMKARAA